MHMVYLSLLSSLLFIVDKCNSNEIEWKFNFEGPTASSKYIKRGCELQNLPMCCSILNSTYGNVGPFLNAPVESQGCTISKVYRPSGYEMHHSKMIREIAAMTDFDQRKKTLLAFFYNKTEVDHSKKWLKRIELRMSNPNIATTDDDKIYLSRFKVTKACGSHQTKWVEWIEPLTIHFRHPFAFAKCRERDSHHHPAPPTWLPLSDIDLQSTEYILLKNGNLSEDISSKGNRFLFDMGSSRFDSSGWWFTCAYAQQGIEFDQIYGFEYDLLEPLDYWSYVPDPILPRYHFYNIPITSGEKSVRNPLNLIRRVSRPEDFVAFKLDVDSPSVEIPVALELQRNKELQGLVDEFFFELHFRCEYMLPCGWNYHPPPEKMNGLVLDRLHAHQFFTSLRQSGIRAHIWP